MWYSHAHDTVGNREITLTPIKQVACSLHCLGPSIFWAVSCGRAQHDPTWLSGNHRRGDRCGQQLVEGLAQVKRSQDDVFIYDSTYQPTCLGRVHINSPRIKTNAEKHSKLLCFFWGTSIFSSTRAQVNSRQLGLQLTLQTLQELEA